MYVGGLKVEWVSGAKTKTNDRLTLCGGPKNYYIDINRPNSYPNVQTDIDYAKSRQQKKNSSAGASILGAILLGAIQVKTAEYEGKAKAYESMRKSREEDERLQKIIRKEIRKTNCTSTVNGSFINTNCY